MYVERLLTGDEWVSSASKSVTRSDLSPDQVLVFDSVVAWLGDDNRRQWVTLGGYAGTGKTTVTAALAQEIVDMGFTVAFCAYTGKAASVLGKKLAAFTVGMSEQCQCSTIHSLIYEPLVDQKTGKVMDWAKKDMPWDLIVVDEASMISTPIWTDLLSYGKPILVVGDHGQLPPIGDNPGLMKSPDFRLEKIHRQAAGNPILALAHHVREGKDIRRFEITDSRVRILDDFVGVAGQMGADSVGVCFKNDTRVLMNNVVRETKGLMGDAPVPGDIVICLKNAKPICNGMRGVIQERQGLDMHDRFPAVVEFPSDGFRLHTLLNHNQFGRSKTFDDLTVIPKGPFYKWGDAGLLFDYGYVLTCHKMQGSAAREVTVMVENWLGKTEDDKRRWLYTAITRATDQLNLVFE